MIYHKNIKRGDFAKVNVDGKWYDAEYLARGHFTKAFRIQDTNEVVLYTKGDCTKEVIAMWGEEGPHLPKIKRHDDYKGFQVFLMPLYYPLTSENKIAWNQFKILKKVWYNVRVSYGIRIGYDTSQAFINNLKGLVSESLREDLQKILDVVVNCGSSVLFEFAKRNLAVDMSGTLILLDVVFMVESVRRRDK